MAGTCKRQSELLECGIGELSLLPLFLDLRGKRALVIGASQGSKWKFELLGFAGAIVDQLDIPPKEMPELRNYSFVVADIADETKAAEFAMAAKVAGVAYNMVDKPELCQFQFGAIVNRSPVIVSITTSGAAPVLAQTIRQRVESILPEISGLGVQLPSASEITSHMPFTTAACAARCGSVLPDWPWVGRHRRTMMKTYCLPLFLMFPSAASRIPFSKFRMSAI